MATWKELIASILGIEPMVVTKTVEVIKEVPVETPVKYSLDLSQYKTTKAYKVNGSYKLLNSLLNSKLQYKAVNTWVEKESILSDLNVSQDIDTLAKALRWSIYGKAQGFKDIHTPDKTENWRTPSETIVAKFKVDCEDMSIFIHYVYQVVADKLNLPELKERLYCNVGSTLTSDGYCGGNHFNLIWSHTDGKYYQIESAWSSGSDYIKNANTKFGVEDLTLNRRFGQSVWMFNNKNIYYKVQFSKGYIK